MKNKKRLLAIGFALAICFQLAVVGWEYLSSVWPLWFGEPVTLKIEPVDPRSLFRGDYVRLTYDINEIPTRMATESFEAGDVVYVQLKKQGPYHSPARMHARMPNQGVFIRGRIANAYHWEENGHYTLKYGIEAFFMPREKAMETERRRNEIDAAQIYLLPNGRAAIHRIHLPE